MVQSVARASAQVQLRTASLVNDVDTQNTTNSGFRPGQVDRTLGGQGVEGIRFWGMLADRPIYESDLLFGFSRDCQAALTELCDRFHTLDSRRLYSNCTGKDNFSEKLSNSGPAAWSQLSFFSPFIFRKSFVNILLWKSAALIPTARRGVCGQTFLSSRHGHLVAKGIAVYRESPISR